MKHLLTAACLLAATAASASVKDAAIATTTPAQDTVAVFNTKTPDHTAICNFDYAIELPNTGYKQTSSNLVTVFRNEEDNASLMVKQYCSKPDADRNISEGTSKPVIINGTAAIIHTSEKKDVKKQTLVYYEQQPGGTVNPLVIEAMCDASDGRTAIKQERSLLSLVATCAPQNGSSTYATSRFCIANGGFKSQHNGLLNTIFTQSGDYEQERKDGRYVYFQILCQQQTLPQKEQKKDAVRKVANLYTDNRWTGKPRKVAMNGMNGYEFDIVLKDEAGKELAKGYIVALYTATTQYLFVANANENAEANITKFKEIARTLKNK